MGERGHFDRIESIDPHEHDRTPDIVRSNGAGAIDALIDENGGIEQILLLQRYVIPGVKSGDGSARAMTMGTVGVEIGTGPVLDCSGWVVRAREPGQMGHGGLVTRRSEQADVVPSAQLVIS